MNEGLKKFRELLLYDKEFQGKLKAAAESYTGEQTEEAVFNGLLVPLAAEYGVTATFTEFKTYMESLSDNSEMSREELTQVAGGDKGFGGTLCKYIGIGGGATSNGGCLGIGGSNGYNLDLCIGEGQAW